MWLRDVSQDRLLCCQLIEQPPAVTLLVDVNRLLAHPPKHLQHFDLTAFHAIQYLGPALRGTGPISLDAPEWIGILKKPHLKREIYPQYREKCVLQIGNNIGE